MYKKMQIQIDLLIKYNASVYGEKPALTYSACGNQICHLNRESHYPVYMGIARLKRAGPDLV